MLKERLIKQRTAKRLSQYDLARLLGLSRGQISNYELGTRRPDYETLTKLADFFGVSVDYLLGRVDDPSPRHANAEASRLIPILGNIRAGLPVFADENFEGTIRVSTEVDADFALRVRGDSMIGVGILPGDLAICRECEAAQSGEIVVALHDISTGYSEATLKYFFNGPQPTLKAAHPRYQDITLTYKHRIIAKVVALARREMPAYEAYANYLAFEEEGWARVIELAISTGLTPADIKHIIHIQKQLSEQLLRQKKEEKEGDVPHRKLTRKQRAWGQIIEEPVIVNYGARRKDGSIRYYYVCNLKTYSSKNKCQNENVNGEDIDHAVIEELIALSRSREPLLEELERLRDDNKRTCGVVDLLDKLKSERKALQDEIDNLVGEIAKSAAASKYILPQIEARDEKAKELGQEISRLEKEREEVERESEGFDLVLNNIMSFADVIDRLSRKEKKNFLQTIVDKVYWEYSLFFYY